MMIRKFQLKAALALSCALTLSGCFNNMSSLDGSGSSKSSQSNSTLNDSGFANETGSINTNAVLIGAYRDTSSASDFGILIDLQKSLLATLGASSVQAILDGIDTNTSMQARSVTIHLPSFGIKATTTLGAIAAGNGKKLRNIMNIRPRLIRVDLTTSTLEVPASPSVLQMKNDNKTVITYGGKIEGDYVRRMTVLIPFAGVNASYLPNSSVPNYGDGYPSASPQEVAGSVKLVRVTPEIASMFNKLITNVPYGAGVYAGIQSDAVKTIVQTRESLALSVHYKLNPMSGLPDTTSIDAAYFININPANSNGPETFPFCHSGYNSQDQTAAYGTAGSEIDFSHPLSCVCTPAVSTTPASPPTAAQFVDPCPTLVSSRKPALIAAAIAATPAAPTSGLISIITPITVGNFVLSAE